MPTTRLTVKVWHTQPTLETHIIRGRDVDDVNENWWEIYRESEAVAYQDLMDEADRGEVTLFSVETLPDDYEYTPPVEPEKSLAGFTVMDIQRGDEGYLGLETEEKHHIIIDTTHEGEIQIRVYPDPDEETPIAEMVVHLPPRKGGFDEA